jgi:dCMP deaminase
MVDKWKKAHMEVAERYAQLSSAERLKVGCVIVKDNRVISIGYNGMPAGWDNACEHIVYPRGWSPTKGVQLEQTTKDEVLHAETNAIAKVARSMESCYNADLYTTTAPCLDCAKLIYQSGISTVYYRSPHLRSEDGIKFLDKCGVDVIQL